jgi:hypothetical protein
MTRTLFERQREGVEVQIRWAILHGGDQELLDLLRIESDRLSAVLPVVRLTNVTVAARDSMPRFIEVEAKTVEPRQ